MFRFTVESLGAFNSFVFPHFVRDLVISAEVGGSRIVSLRPVWVTQPDPVLGEKKVWKSDSQTIPFSES
jgi:hypothetical protein